jgi:hypothetical protein
VCSPCHCCPSIIQAAIIEEGTPLRSIDFSSWQSLVTTLLGLAVFTLIGVGVRLIAMMTIQQRRERQNRQINERLRTLMAAYKTLGGSFTGRLSVDPSHLGDLRRTQTGSDAGDPILVGAPMSPTGEGSDRARRIRDAVEAALSDIILLGTEEQVRLAAQAARELALGRPVPTHNLVVSLRDFIREALDLDPIPKSVELPVQGPTRPSNTSGRAKGDQGDTANKQAGGRNGGSGGGMGAGGDDARSQHAQDDQKI